MLDQLSSQSETRSFHVNILTWELHFLELSTLCFFCAVVSEENISTWAIVPHSTVQAAGYFLLAIKLSIFSQLSTLLWKKEKKSQFRVSVKLIYSDNVITNNVEVLW